MSNSTGIDIEAILDGLPPTRPVSAFDKWLSENPRRAADFWRLIEVGQARGHGLGPLVDAWNAHSDSPCPVKYNQVRLKLRERGERAQKRD